MKYEFIHIHEYTMKTEIKNQQDLFECDFFECKVTEINPLETRTSQCVIS